VTGLVRELLGVCERALECVVVGALREGFIVVGEEAVA